MSDRSEYCVDPWPQCVGSFHFIQGGVIIKQHRRDIGAVQTCQGVPDAQTGQAMRICDVWRSRSKADKWKVKITIVIIISVRKSGLPGRQ